MYSFILILLAIEGNAANQNSGHLKAFGSVGSLINIEELHREFPTVSKLFTYYIPRLEPILSRQDLNEDRHHSIWQMDKQLLSQVYGLAETNIDVQSFKSRQQQRLQMTFEDFLHRYGREPLLFADQAPVILQKYLVVPKPLQCEAALDTFQSAILLMNGINASPLLLNEEYDHFHCILRGSKRFVLVNTSKYPDVRKIVVPERRDQRQSPVNPERVDFNQFPALAEVDYHRANLTSGDCLLIPSGWIFQERSLENTIAMIYNIKHHLALNISPKELETCAEYDPTFTLDQIDWSTEREPMNFKELITSFIHSKLNGFDQWQDGFSKYLTYDIAADPEVSALFEEFYALIDIDADGIITATEVEQIAGEHLRHITDILYEMTKMINTNRKKSPSKPVNIKDEHLPEAVNLQESIDEHLHLQNYKTDL